MYYLETGYNKHSRFRNAVLAAMVAHCVLVLSVSFNINQSDSYTPPIEVTLSTQPSAHAPDDARHVAQTNQVGSGNRGAVDQLSIPSDLPSSTQQQQGQQQTSQSAQRSDAITTTAVARHLVNAEEADRDQRQTRLEGISPEVDRLNRELASLQAKLQERTSSFADKPRVRRLSAASAKQSADAAYLLDWRRRLEAVGNKYYPETSIRYGIYGDVRLLVVIRRDGSLEEVRVLSPSGFAVLDEAAIKVVRMAAPYSPFPAELAATTDKLEIVRTWHYLENQLSSN